MIIRVRTTLRAALSKLPAPVMAWMLDSGLLEEWPPELTRHGKRAVRVVYL